MSILHKIFAAPYKTRLDKARSLGVALLWEIEEAIRLDSQKPTVGFLSAIFLPNWMYHEEKKRHDFFNKATKPKLFRISKKLAALRESLIAPRLESLFEGRKDIISLSGLNKDLSVRDPEELPVILDEFSQSVRTCLRLIDREIHSLYSRV